MGLAESLIKEYEQAGIPVAEIINKKKELKMQTMIQLVDVVISYTFLGIYSID